MEIGGVFNFALSQQCRGNARPLYHLAKKQQSKVKHNRLRGENGHGFTNWLSPQCGAFSRDLLNEKSKSPLFPRAGGGGFVTND